MTEATHATTVVAFEQTLNQAGTYVTTLYQTFSWLRRDVAATDFSAEVVPGTLETPTPKTTVIEVILSNEAGKIITLQEVTFTPTLRHALILPTHLVRAQHEQDQPTVSLIRASSSLPEQTPFSSQKVVESSVALNRTMTLAPSFVTVTKLRPHLLNITSTSTAYLDVWPQIGSVPAESDVPPQWRETFETNALRQQYIALGAICAIFVIGIVCVLAIGCLKCLRDGRRGREEMTVEREHKWEWF